MSLPCQVHNHAGIEGQQVADVARSGIGNVGNFFDIENTRVGGLLGIDAAGGGDHTDLLLDDRFVRQRKPDRLLGSADLTLQSLVEARFLHRSW